MLLQKKWMKNQLIILLPHRCQRRSILRLKHAEMHPIRENSMGFFPNGDLILVSLMDYRIYLYSLKISQKQAETCWKYSQIYEQT